MYLYLCYKDWNKPVDRVNGSYASGQRLFQGFYFEWFAAFTELGHLLVVETLITQWTTSVPPHSAPRVQSVWLGQVRMPQPHISIKPTIFYRKCTHSTLITFLFKSQKFTNIVLCGQTWFKMIKEYIWLKKST